MLSVMEIKSRSSSDFSVNPMLHKPTDPLTELEEYIESEFEELNANADEYEIYNITFIDESKNRYSDVVPIDKTRVKIREKDYINANYISYPGVNNTSYIATQGPLVNTVNDFWRMVWENNTEIIVMLCNLYEGSKQKCYKYWPNNSNNTNNTIKKYGDINVEYVNTVKEGNCIIRNFNVTHKDDANKDDVRVVYQLHYTGWPDFGVPQNNEEFKQLISLYKKLQSMRVLENGYDIVHCSAGVGRTGCFISIDIGLQLLNLKQYCDVLEIVKGIRKCRQRLVQHIDQYKYVYTVLLDHINSV